MTCIRDWLTEKECASVTDENFQSMHRLAMQREDNAELWKMLQRCALAALMGILLGIISRNGWLP